MKRVKVILDKANAHRQRIREAVALVNASQKYFLMELSDVEMLITSTANGVDPEGARSQVVSSYPDGNVILVVTNPFTDNWFTHPHRECQIITIADWERVYSPPSLRAYLVYHFVEALLTFEADLSEDMLISFAHEPPQGCISDFCGHKPDVKLGMAAGNLCPVCEATLSRYGMSADALDALRRILTVVRGETIGRPTLLDPDTAFVVMRFSSNDENSNAYLYGVKQGLTDVGITPVRGDDTVSSSQILDQVFRYIQRSRFVVAKVDVENLNVYFELGIAMGLDKDVLLISERSLVVSLPSDLRNWECLTYTKGKYEELRGSVANYFEDNYGRTRTSNATS